MERLYNVPLRRGAMKSPIHSRAKRATKVLREFVVKHMKSEDIVFTAPVNERIWERGMKKPPHHIKIRATKDKEGKVTVELADGTVKEAESKPKKGSESKKPATSTTSKETTDKPAETAKEDSAESEKPKPNAKRSDSKQARAAKAPVADEPAEESAVKAPEPRPDESPESSKGTKNQ